MWLPFQLGIGGVLGHGRQMMSWVVLDEIPYVIDHLLKSDKMTGAVNVVTPKAVSNAEFTKVLGQVIRKPTFLPVPAFAIRLLFGEMGEQLLLEGANIKPLRLQENGYQFHYANLKDALERVINK
jgi:NAD dependent epimerase/dehydratase family enzyme